MSHLRNAMMGMAVAAALGSLSRVAEDEVPKEPKSPKPLPEPRGTAVGNPSGHTPHQGAKEMARRAKRLAKEKTP